MLSAQQLADYHERGYVVPDFRMSEQDLADIRAAHERLVAKSQTTT